MIRSRPPVRPSQILATGSAVAGLVLVGLLIAGAPSPPAVQAEKSAAAGWLRITHHDDAPESGPAGNEISDLLVGPSGDLWVGTNRGLSRLRGGAFHPVGRRQGLPHEQVVELAATAAGVVAATPEGMAFLDELGPPDRPAAVLCKGPVRSVAVHERALWFVVDEIDERRRIFRHPLASDGRPAGLRTESERPVRCQDFPVEIEVGERIRGVFAALPGSLFVLDAEGDLRRHRIRDGSLLEDRILEPDEALLQVHSAGNRTWLLTSKRLLAFPEDTAERLPDIDLGRDPDLLAPGREGRAWIGRRGELWEIDLGSGEVARNMSLPAGTEVRAMAEDLGGRIWVGTGRGLLMSDPHSRILALPASEDTAAQPAGEPTEDAAGTARAAGFDDAGQLWLDGGGRIVFPEAGDGDCSAIPFEGMVRDASFVNQALAVTDAGLVRLVECKTARLPLASERFGSEMLERLEDRDILLHRLYPTILAQLRTRANEEGVSLEQLERRDRLLDWLLEHHDEAEISAALTQQCVVLAAFEEEAVVRLESRDIEAMWMGLPGNEELHLLRGEVDHRLPWSVLTDELSQAVPDPAFRGLMALNEDGDLLAFDAALKARLLQAPIFSEKRALYPGTAPGKADRPLLADDGGLWRWTDGSPRWTRLAQLFSAPTVSGILPDPQGGGALIGCMGCGDANLYRAAADGTVSPLPFDDKKVGCGNNGLLRDSRGRVWISAEDALYMGAADGSNLEPVRDANGKVLNAYLNALIEFPEGSGKIWGSSGGPGSRKGVWVIEVIEDRHSPRQILETEGFAFALLGARGTVWAGGAGFLKVLDAGTGAETEDRWDDVVANIKEPLPDELTIQGLARDGDDVLALTNAGMVRLAPYGAKPVFLEGGWPSNIDDNCCEMLMRHDGGIVAVARHENGTRMWTRPFGSSDFVKIPDVPIAIVTIAEDATGALLFNVGYGNVYALEHGLELGLVHAEEQGHLTLRWNLAKQEGVLVGSSLAGVCALGPEKVLVRGKWRYPVVIDSQKEDFHLSVALEPWTACVPVSESAVLLLHHDSVSILNLSSPEEATLEQAAFEPPEERPTAAHQLVQMAREGQIVGGYAWLLGERFIWVYSAEEAVFRSLVARPSRLLAASSELRMAVDEDGIWLASPGSGVWRWSGDPCRPGAGETGWKTWDDSDGLPAANVRAIVPRERGRALIFTSAGMARARRESPGEWTFEPLKQGGFLRHRVHAAALFHLGGGGESKLMALGTERGLTVGLLAAAADEVPQVSRWWHLGPNQGVEGEVRALHWSAAREELWLGGEQELRILRLQLETGPDADLSFNQVAALGPVDGLPRGPITEIRVSADGKEAWLLSGHRISRWRREKGELLSSDPYLFSDFGRDLSEELLFSEYNLSQADPHLGPAVDGKAPRLLVRDVEGRPALWDLGNEARPRLELSHWFFLVFARLKVDRLAPQAGEKWSARFVLDRLPGAGWRTTWWWALAPDLFRLPRPHTVVARVTRGDTGKSVVVVEPLPEISLAAWWGRLTILLLVFATGIGVTLGHLRQRRLRRHRVRLREMPYVVGEAVRGEQFLGRQALVRKLCDTVGENSYALLGPLGMGKSSILQHLSWCLESQESSHYAFFPLYIDLSQLDREDLPWDEHIFHSLGRNLVRFAASRNCEQEIPAEFHGEAAADPSRYGSLELVEDIEILLDYLREQCAPRAPVLLFELDEAALLERLSYEALLALRAVFVDSKNAQVVLSGETIPADETGGSLSPWRNFLKEVIEVRPLTPDQARELILAPARGLFHFEDGAINEMIGLAQGNPLVLRRLCANLVRYMYQEQGARRRISREDFEGSLRWVKDAGLDLFTDQADAAEGLLKDEQKSPDTM